MGNQYGYAVMFLLLKRELIRIDFHNRIVLPLRDISINYCHKDTCLNQTRHLTLLFIRYI